MQRRRRPESRHDAHLLNIGRVYRAALEDGGQPVERERRLPELAHGHVQRLRLALQHARPYIGPDPARGSARAAQRMSGGTLDNTEGLHTDSERSQLARLCPLYTWVERDQLQGVAQALQGTCKSMARTCVSSYEVGLENHKEWRHQNSYAHPPINADFVDFLQRCLLA